MQADLIFPSGNLYHWVHLTGVFFIVFAGSALQFLFGHRVRKSFFLSFYNQ